MTDNNSPMGDFDWLWQQAGLYRSADGARELVYDIEGGCWWDAPAGSNAASLDDVGGPFDLARSAGRLDQPPSLGDNATHLEES